MAIQLPTPSQLLDVATEVAKRLGVSVKFVTPDWSLITAGSWSGRRRRRTTAAAPRGR